MLKTIDPLIGPELLGVLARMGHGDTLAVVDSNYPAYAAGVPVVRMDGINSIEAIRAIASLLPIDTFEPLPIARMAVVNRPATVPEVAVEALEVLEAVENRAIGVEVLDRHAFYARARTVTAVVSTGEARPYGCFILTKGVLVDADEPRLKAR
ncbi:RbsD/FucU family protein [Leifsonia sp. NPDC056665]|uniref:RbsD/FucU family protein n=1 Tax=Leifsonia sp. NPDC056665 TaxID=3345901 RepID=UPI0036A97864